MPLRVDFFDAPMIRAAPTCDLNDPFEGHFNEKQVREADIHQREFYRRYGEDVYEADEDTVQNNLEVIQSEFFDLGILSFTEDYNNPLMWAHYADEHRGVVVEFDFSKPFFMDSVFDCEGRKSRFGKNYLSDVFEYPEKVDYRRVLPNFERPEFAEPDTRDEFHWKKFNRSILFTKANDWIYEKEQRSIVRLEDADSIIFPTNEHVRTLCKEYPEITLIEKDKTMQVVYPNEYEMHEDMGDESIRREIFFLTRDFSNPPIHLFRINPVSISAVYFGYRSDYELALNMISKNESLSHLHNIYRMIINESDYRFDEVKLTRR